MSRKVRVVVGGTFDIIHLGHLKFLWAAKKVAENTELIVIVARDSTVRKLKGRDPVFNEKERLEIVQNLKPVDKAILGRELDKDSFYDILQELKPDIVVLGYDQKFSEKDIKKWAEQQGLSLKIIRLPKFSFNGLESSSEVRKKILKIFTKTKGCQT
ncbi:MAG: adenylyltransferase/cytidyltransferase family protein [Candidatus Njordarchaeales archaeon]